MTSSIFLVKNIDTLLLSIESLDLYTIDSLVTKSSTVNIKELFLFRNHIILKYNNYYQQRRLYYIAIILHHIIQKTKIQYLRKNIQYILKDLSVNDINSSNYSLNTKTYIQRFILNYRIRYKPHLTGYDKYTDEAWLVKVSIMNLFLLHELCESKKLYQLFIYLKYHSRHA